MTSKKKILILINALTTGGAENQVAAIVNLLGDRFEFHIITILANDERFLRENINPKIVTVHPLNAPKNIIWFPVVFLKMLAVTKRIKPDLVHGVLFQSNILVRLMKYFTGIRTLNSVYDVSEEPPFHLRLLKWTNSRVDRIIFDNTAGKINYVEKKIMRADQVKYTPNGIDPDNGLVVDDRLVNDLLQQVHFKEGENLWLNVSRFVIQKDHKTLIASFELLLQEYPQNKLLLVGDGALVPETLDMIKQKGLEQNIFYLGRINDVYTLCRMCGQYVCASAWEGMPIIIMQSMLYRLPVVSTNVGAIPDLIENGVTGYLCERRNPAALFEAMKSMTLAGEDQKQSIRGKAYKKITEEFSLQKMKENWYNNYIAEINRD